MSEQFLREKFKSLKRGVTPGFALQVYYRGQKKINLEWGKTWKYYDLASLTKILFTVPWLIKVCDEKKINLNHHVPQYLGGISGNIPIHRLLSHSAGNDWWRPFYKSIDLESSMEMRKIQLHHQLNHLKLKNSSKAVYSDVDFFLLGFLLENVTQKNWIDLFAEISSDFYKTDDLFFNLNNNIKSSKSQYAPTEKCPWRKRVLQGEVHDENAWSIGGIAPHAGLFGTVDAVSKWGLQLRKIYRQESKGWLTSKNLHLFTQRKIQDWSLGFMMPTPGASSAGDYFSLKSFGHTGFTGTSWWYDPQKDLMVTLLSNRIYPDRKNNEFKNWRPLIHNWICESLNLK